MTGRDYKREQIREYFNHTCQKCKKKWQEGQRRFDVHHIKQGSKMTRKYDSNPDFKKLALLCHKCHLSLPEHRKAMMGKRCG